MLRANRGRAPHGFTIVEMAVAMAIVLILAALAFSSVARQRPRANLADTAADLQSAIHGARLRALASGHDVVVMVFPQYATGQGTGRVIVYEDGSYDFFSASGAPSFGGYNAAVLASNAQSQVVSTLDLPRGVTIGPPTGMGSTATLPAPLAGIDVRRACSFCSTTGDGRGAIKFDGRGRASFYTANGAPLAIPAGASLSLTAAPEIEGMRTLAITPVTGAVRTFNNG